MLSLKNYRTVIPALLLKKSEKDAVRELDEIEKGHFQAYVDEKGKDSFDVSIMLNSQGEVIGHSCDCIGDKGICKHKVAVIAFIAKGRTKEVPPKKNKKTDPLDVVLDTVDTEALKFWVKNLLSKNKDLQLAFLHQFSEEKKNYAPEDVKRLTEEAVKAVIRNKKTVEVSEIKKIIDLWAEIHEPIIDQYCRNVTDEQAFLNFNAIIETCEAIYFRLQTSSNRFAKYVERVLSKVIAPIHDLQLEDAWDAAVAFFVVRIHFHYNHVRYSYLPFLSDLSEASTLERKERLIKRLVGEYSKNYHVNILNGDDYTILIFNIVKKAGLFHLYHTVFKPLRYKNDYNEHLIKLLIENGKLQIAEQYCKEQIGFNFKQEYNTVYLQLLKKIYSIEGEDKKLSEVLRELLPLTFDFDDFLFIYQQHDDEEEKKKWRTKILTRARHMAYSNTDAMFFSFRLMDYEGRYKKMIECIDDHTPYPLIVKYAAKMVQADKNVFLKEIFKKRDSYFGWMAKDETDNMEIVFQELLDILLQYYPEIELQMIIKQYQKSGSYFSPGVFFEFIKKRLIEQ